VPAERALVEVERAAVDFAIGLRRWLSANWIEFFRYISGNPRLSWTRDILDGVLSNTLGNAIAEGAEFIGKRGVARFAGAATGTTVGAFVAGPPGAIAGFVVGVLIETAVGLIYDAINGSPEESAAAEASRRTGSLIEHREQALQAQEQDGIAAARELIDEARQRLETASDAAEIEGIRATADAEARDFRLNIPNLADLGLATRMLREWVLEHAGDEEDADRETSEPEWEAARTRAFGEGDLDASRGSSLSRPART
jgi:hypothetical protein